MEVTATRKVCYNGNWYDAGDTFECNPKTMKVYRQQVLKN